MSATRGALLIDLDDTLVVEEPAAVASFAAAAAMAAAAHGVDADALAVGARSRARELWHTTPVHPYCRRIGISSWEGLWGRFAGEHPDVRWLREWAPSYRLQAWRLALGDQGVDDDALAGELGERYVVECRARHICFEDSATTLSALHETHVLALLTNGDASLQRDKLAASGLAEHFDAVVVSGEFGVAKPDAAIFHHTIAQLPAHRGRPVMVGDSMARDVDGALAAGLDAVWVNRHGADLPAGRSVTQIATLSELPGVL